ncbi:unnamed protein product [Psylliodes chrysocephalus]|uniref:Uncharacterized protein n=1 Tax=Psylliodes chrysocephalus TaxID=3402493 RepID=A0A9P0GNM7_9CUCU|nr:unnamed protein product [Psylliodes chrysocephala]
MNHKLLQSVRYPRVGWVCCIAFGLWLQLVSSSLMDDRSLSIRSHHSITKRSFKDLQCKGVYDKSIFARLDQICEDCYNLFREPPLYTMCRDRCFSTKAFGGCCESLLCENVDEIKDMIKQLNGGRIY